MEIPKQQILEFLKSQGHGGKADQADRDLPGTVDTDRDSGLLDKLGISVPDLIAKFAGGGAGGALGGLLGR